MMEVEFVAQLKTVPLFSKMDDEVLAELAAGSECRQFPSGTAVFREGDRARELYVILSGEVAIEKTTEAGAVRLAVLRPYSCFGDMSVFDEAPRSATARTGTECSLLCLAGSALRVVCRRHPELYEEFIKILSRRLRQTDARFAAVG